MGTVTTSTAHAVPPTVEVDARGPDRDVAVITLDLEGGAIARTIVRQLGKALGHPVNGAYWLRIIGAGGPGADEWITRTVGAARSRNAFQVDLSLDAAQALYEELGRALEVAETECRSEGCHAIGVIDGHCAADDERLDTRRAG